MSEYNSQLREFVARLQDAEIRLNKVANLAGAFVQAMDMLSPGNNGDPGLVASYSGTLDGCGGGLSGQAITITDHGTGAVLGTSTTGAAGAIAGAVPLTSSPQSVDLHTSVTGYTATATNFSFSTGSNAVGTITLASGTGSVLIHVCGGYCAPTSIPFTDSIFFPTAGNHLVWDGVSQWTACISGLAYSGGIICGSNTIAIHYALDVNGNLTMNWAVNGGSGCPIASTCGTTTNATSTPGVVSSSCVSHTITYGLGNASVETHLRIGHTSQTVTIDFT